MVRNLENSVALLANILVKTIDVSLMAIYELMTSRTVLEYKLMEVNNVRCNVPLSKSGRHVFLSIIDHPDFS